MQKHFHWWKLPPAQCIMNWASFPDPPKDVFDRFNQFLVPTSLLLVSTQKPFISQDKTVLNICTDFVCNDGESALHITEKEDTRPWI